MKKVVVAEDNAADVYLLQESLSNFGEAVEMQVLSDGEQAIHYFDSLAGAENFPDLILLDLNLPKADGTEILRRIRQRPEFELIPVVMFTTAESPEDQELAAQLGADDFVTKPSDLDAFLSVGERLLGAVRRIRPAAGPPFRRKFFA